MIFNYFWHFKEDIRDLLSKDQSKRLELKERPDTGIYVKVYVIKKLLLMIILLFLAWWIWWPLDQVAWVQSLGTLCCVLELVTTTLVVPPTTQLHTCKWGNNRVNECGNKKIIHCITVHSASQSKINFTSSTGQQIENFISYFL